MTKDPLFQIFSTLKVSANVFHNGQYCGNWAVNTSGQNYINFHLVTHGECELTLPGKDDVTTLASGDIVIFPRDAQHRLAGANSLNAQENAQVSVGMQSDEDDGTGLVCGHLSHQHPMVKDITRHLPDCVIVRGAEPAHQSLCALVNALRSESYRADHDVSLVMSKLAETIMILLFRDHLHGDSGVLAASLHPKLGPVMEALHTSPATAWTVDELAKLAGQSRSGFTDTFRTVMGMSVMNYLTQWRLSLAYRRLADEQISVLQAALESGYDNESSFSKAFKRVMGVSPGAVRQRNSA